MNGNPALRNISKISPHYYSRNYTLDCALQHLNAILHGSAGNTSLTELKSVTIVKNVGISYLKIFSVSLTIH